MSNHLASAREDLERYLEASQALRESLRANEAVYRKVARRLEKQDPVATVLAEAEVAKARLALREASDEFEHQRHRARLALVRAGLDEGMSIGDLGRAWGFSRQLAARYAKESRTES